MKSPAQQEREEEALKALVASIKNLQAKRHVRNVSWIFLGQALTFFLQAGYFILLARLLGATQYGIFAGVFALVNTVTPYSALGGGTLFMRYVSADEENASVYWGNSLLATGCTTLLFAGIFALIAPWIAKGASTTLVINVVIANCLFSQVVMLAGKVFQTKERLRSTALLSFLTNLGRFLVLVLLVVTLRHADATQWSFGLLAASAAASLIAVRMIHRVIPRWRFDPALILRRAWEGLTYSVSGTTQAVYNDIDKTMLSHYGMNAQNGLYTVAYRVIDFASTPAGAVDVASLPRFFALNRDGIRPVVRFAVKALAASAAISCCVAAITWALAPVVPHLVGGDYHGVIEAIRWLCLLPLFRAIHTICGSALTATNNQSLRLFAQLSVALFNFGLNLWLIPTHGWLGAAWASLLSDGLLAVANVTLLGWKWRSAQGHPAH